MVNYMLHIKTLNFISDHENFLMGYHLLPSSFFKTCVVSSYYIIL